MAEAFIKLYNKMLKWGWYDDTNTFRLFMHCLLKANWCPCEWHGIQLDAGQFVTSLPNLSKETHLSVSQVRTSLSHLTLTGELADKSHGKYRVITVVKWNEYQGNDRLIADKSQIDSSLIASTKDIKNKDIKTINNNIYKNNRGFTPPSVDQVKEYCLERNNNVDPEAFVSFYESKGWMVGKNKMKDWKAAVRTWEKSSNKSSGTDKSKSKKPQFDSFPQREYDFDELMKIVTD